MGSGCTEENMEICSHFHFFGAFPFLSGQLEESMGKLYKPASDSLGTSLMKLEEARQEGQRQQGCLRRASRTSAQTCSKMPFFNFPFPSFANPAITPTLDVAHRTSARGWVS